MPCGFPAMLVAFIPFGAAAGAAELRVYPTPSYVIHSDLAEAAAKEAAVRLTVVFQEYDRLTRAFAGSMTEKLPFYLFQRAEDYQAAGGPVGSAGVYTGDRLMAIAGDPISESTWYVIQHEGFHQFVHARITGDIPIWVDEGLAEYFAEGVFTGDRLITGLIPAARLGRVRKQIEANSFRSIPEMMQLSHDAWNRESNVANYDQAWSMVYFLAHGDNGRYRSRMDGFLLDMGRHAWPWERAWLKHFGPVDGSFEKAWRLYWLNLPDEPSRTGYADAMVITLTNFLAAAHSQKQEFATAEEFIAAAQEGKLKMTVGAGLVPNLLKSALDRGDVLCKWSLVNQPKKTPKLKCVLEDGTSITGSFTAGGKAARTEIKRPS